MDLTRKQAGDQGNALNLESTRRKFLLQEEQRYATPEHERRWPNGLTQVVLDATLGNEYARRKVNHLSLPWSAEYRDEKDWTSHVMWQSLFGGSSQKGYGEGHPYDIKNGAVSPWFDEITSQCGL